MKKYDLDTLLHEAERMLDEEEGLMLLYKDREKWDEFAREIYRVGGIRLMVNLIRLYKERADVHQ